MTALFQCPTCKGPHFNVNVEGKLVCASVTEKTDYEIKVGGCGWKGYTPSVNQIKAEAGRAGFEACMNKSKEVFGWIPPTDWLHEYAASIAKEMS
jgi:hypothetical protein